MNFPKRKAGIYFWLTEYEPSKKRDSLRNKKVKTPPNGVSKIFAIDAVLTTEDAKFLAKFSVKKDKQMLTLSGGTPVYYTQGRRSRIKSIVVQTDNLSKIAKNFEYDELVSFRNLPGVLIRNPDRKMWDVIVVENKK